MLKPAPMKRHLSDLSWRVASLGDGYLKKNRSNSIVGCNDDEATPPVVKNEGFKRDRRMSKNSLEVPFSEQFQGSDSLSDDETS